jgi:hypothetical protein
MMPDQCRGCPVSPPLAVPGRIAMLPSYYLYGVVASDPGPAHDPDALPVGAWALK